MKLSDPNSESFEFNLETIHQKCCIKTSGPCGTCESCIIEQKITFVKSWIEKVGDQSRKRFMLGLVRRINSFEALCYLKSLLQATLNGKDYTYARIRTNPNLETDRWTTSGDRVINISDLEEKVFDLWKWFELSNYYVKVKFLLKVMKFCEVHLMFVILKQLQTQLAQEHQSSEKKEILEPTPLISSDYSFNTEEHPELDLLISTKPYYSKIENDALNDNSVPISNVANHEVLIDQHRRVRSAKGVRKQPHNDYMFPKDNNGRPWTPQSLQAYRDKEFEMMADTDLMDKSLKEIQHEREERYKYQDMIIAMNQSPKRPKSSSKWQHKPKTHTKSQYVVDEASEDTDTESQRHGRLSPACFVIATTNKAHSGVTKNYDFIAQLPVHLSKYILSMLSTATVRTCLHVSQHWHMLAREVLREKILCSQMKLEVKQLQVASRGCNPVYAKDVDVLVPNVTPGSVHCIRTEPAKHDDTNPTTALDSGLIDVELNEDSNPQTVQSPMQKAYDGYSTRKIIMEERNVYCGAFNVMVLAEQYDTFRVVHSSGGKLLGQSYMDRRIKFVDCKTGKLAGPVVIGHAGTIRCLELLENRGLIFSGSYDTSIRCWSIITGKCQKIYRGHNGTVTCLHTYGTCMISGGRDGQCRVWDILSGSCQWAARQQYPVSSVQLGEHVCVSGSEDAKVYVWDVKSGSLIKKLALHTANVTAVRLDRWHILSASVDGYAYMWTTQGDHDRPLVTLKHNSPVLCLEFMYMRAITGSADGKLRIWNVLTGQCIRILRGNSKNEPIYQIIACKDRLILNTPTYLLALNFEAVELQYTLPNDSMPPLVKYGKYTDAPIRDQPYSYIRAQRMRSAGAASRKLLSKSAGAIPSDGVIRKRVKQLPHSAMVLSERRIESAKRVLSGRSDKEVAHTCLIPRETKSAKAMIENTMTFRSKLPEMLNPDTGEKILIAPHITPEMIAYMKLTGDLTGTMPTDEEDSEDEEIKERQRRISWTFELMQHDAQATGTAVREMPSLTDTKLMLRTQMRTKSKDIVPSYIQHKIDEMHANLKTDDVIEAPARRDLELEKCKQTDRPTSSPGWIDPRTKITASEQKDLVQKLQLSTETDKELFRPSHDACSLTSGIKMKKAASANMLQTCSDFNLDSAQYKDVEELKRYNATKEEPRRMSCAECRDELKAVMAAATLAASNAMPLRGCCSPSSEMQLAASALKRRIPESRSRIALDVPTSACSIKISKSDVRKLEPKTAQQSLIARPVSVSEMSVKSGLSVPTATKAQVLAKGMTHAKCDPTAENLKGDRPYRAKTASGTSLRHMASHSDELPKDTNAFVPILFYPKELKDKVEQLKMRQQKRQGFAVSSDFFEEPKEGYDDIKKQSVYADVLRRNSGFRLLTNSQVQEQVANSSLIQEVKKPVQNKSKRDLSQSNLVPKGDKSKKTLTKSSSENINTDEHKQRKVNVSSVINVI